MKNLIDPKELVVLKSKPATYEIILEFLDRHPRVAAGYVCKAVGVPPENFYSWRRRHQKSKDETADALGITIGGGGVVPVGANKRKYSAEDKVTLLREYERLDQSKTGEFFRIYGLYETDLARWQSVADQAAVEALRLKRQGPPAKSSEQLKIEELTRELQGQEKVISKLSALVVVQKKISTILGGLDTI